MSQLPQMWKQHMAQMIRWRWLQRLMVLGIYVTVPRHRMGVSVVVLDNQERVLLLHHVFHPYVRWGLPGGWLGRNEAPADCALRELREETGLSGQLGPLLQLTYGTPPGHLNVGYLLEIEAPVALTLSAEILKAQWFCPDELPSPLLPFTHKAIEAALEMKGCIEGKEDKVR